MYVSMITTHLNLVLNELDWDTEFLRTSFPIATMSYCTDHVNRSNTMDCDHRPYKHHNSFDLNIPSEHRNLVHPPLHMYSSIPCELQKLHFRILEYISESRKKQKKGIYSQIVLFRRLASRHIKQKYFICFVDIKCLELRRIVCFLCIKISSLASLLSYTYSVHC